LSGASCAPKLAREIRPTKQDDKIFNIFMKREIMALISVSIDITGSTELKRQIKEISKGNQAKIKKLYREYARKLYDIEMKVYISLLRSKLNLENIYVIKTLGDETWFVYDIKNTGTKTPQFNNKFHTIFRSLTEIYKNPPEIIISKRENIRPDIMVRTYIDLINDYQEISRVRAKSFEGNLKQFIMNENRLDDKILFKKLPKYIANLNIGYYLGRADKKNVIFSSDEKYKIKISHRYDIIGHEVDLFFRCTKSNAVYPGITAIGKNLFENLYIEKKEDIKKNDSIRDYQLLLSHPDGIKSINYDMLYCMEINKNDIKGIEENYNIYYLINDGDLPDEISMRINNPNEIYKPTIDFLYDINFWNNNNLILP
jgi:hypothetical protein